MGKYLNDLRDLFFHGLDRKPVGAGKRSNIFSLAFTYKSTETKRGMR